MPPGHTGRTGGRGTSDGFAFEEIGECLNELGKNDKAKPYFAKAYEALSKIDWVAEDTERMEYLKKLAGK